MYNNIFSMYNSLFIPIVVTFQRRYFERGDVERLSDIEKYELAIKNAHKANLYYIKEYEDCLNDCKPMERRVLTYIVNVPLNMLKDSYINQN